MPVFRGPADRRWWHVVLGDDAASWTMNVRVDEITGIRFVREPYPFPSFAGRESLTVQFLGPGGETVLYCYVGDLYDGQQMRPEKLDVWRALRERYGNRDESRVDRGALLAGRLNHGDHPARVRGLTCAGLRATASDDLVPPRGGPALRRPGGEGRSARPAARWRTWPE